MIDETRALVLINACEALDVTLWNTLKDRGMAPDALWREGPRLWRLLGLSESVQKRLSTMISNGWTEREIERCDEAEIRLITIEDETYPEDLRNISRPPLVLYVSGCWPLPDRRIGIVGTRRCSGYGFRVAHSLGCRVASVGGTVISGGAAGIDGAAHGGALERGGVTVAIFGTGIDRVWPRGHEDLFRRIAEDGTLISEYPLGTPGRAWRFPRRNRIIAGLCEKLVVVESPQKGGAMITARLAMDGGREVWAVPGRMDEAVCRGSNGLISDGAHALVDLDEFVEMIAGGQMELWNLLEEPTDASARQPLSGDERLVLTLVREKGDRTVDEIAVETKLDAANILTIMGGLLAAGLVYSSGPGRWRAEL